MVRQAHHERIVDLAQALTWNQVSPTFVGITILYPYRLRRVIGR